MNDIATATGLSFPTQKEAITYLQEQGYKLEKSKFSKDFKANRVIQQPDGTEACADVNWTPSLDHILMQFEAAAQAPQTAQKSAPQPRPEKRRNRRW